jgi:ribosomal protein S18 acetylase RimI-like enzyme
MPEIAYAPMQRKQAAQLSALTNRGYAASEIPLGMTASEFLAMFDEPHVDLAHDSLVASIDGEPVAWCRVWHQPAEDRLERAFIFGEVDTIHRRKGIGTHLIRWGDARGAERLLERQNDLPKYLRADVAPGEADKKKILAGIGMDVVRYFDNMTRPLTVPLPEVVTDGFTIEPWDMSRSEEIRMVLVEAFRDHWGSAGIDQHGFENWMAAEGTRHDLSFLAVSDGKIIGYSANAHHKGDSEAHGRHEAWIDSLGTLKEHRGKGVATALLAASMHAMRDAGFESAGLDVDSANPTGAHGLYRRLGFELTYQSAMWERQVD